MWAGQWWVDEVNKRGNGEVVIEVQGGPDVMSGIDQPKAVQSGVIDITVNYAGWVEDLVPEAGMFYGRRLDTYDMRKRGAYDYLTGKFANAGLRYIGPMGELQGAYFMCLTESITRPQELEGRTVATFSTLKNWLKALGINVTLMKPGDRYAAVERGVAEGTAETMVGMAARSMWEVAGYLINHGVLASSTNAMMNLDKWNSLPQNAKDLLTEVYLELEHGKGLEIYEKALGDKRNQLRDEGMELIEFSPQDVAYYETLAFEASWEMWHEKWPTQAPEVYALWGTK
jgi:TRAP-type C4-dicarboxylate transport system substrate-binding protein